MPQISEFGENVRLMKLVSMDISVYTTLVRKLANRFLLGKEMPGLFETSQSQTCTVLFLVILV